MGFDRIGIFAVYAKLCFWHSAQLAVIIYLNFVPLSYDKHCDWVLSSPRLSASCKSWHMEI